MPTSILQTSDLQECETGVFGDECHSVVVLYYGSYNKKLQALWAWLAKLYTKIQFKKWCMVLMCRCWFDCMNYLPVAVIKHYNQAIDRRAYFSLREWSVSVPDGWRTWQQTQGTESLCLNHKGKAEKGR